MTKKECIWAIYSNIDESRTLHHCFHDIEKKSKCTGEISIRGAALCNKNHHVYDENEIPLPISELNDLAGFHQNTACRSCLRVYNKLPD